MLSRKVTLLAVIAVLLGVSLTLTAGSSIDETMGVIDKGKDYATFQKVELPEGFNPVEARENLKRARENGNIERAEKLSFQLHTWWLKNREIEDDPKHTGYNKNHGPPVGREGQQMKSGKEPDWGGDIRIEPESGVRAADIASLSDGDLYTISVWDSAGREHILMHRSTDGGNTWDRYYNYDPGSNIEFHSPGITVANDTLITWYVLNRTSGTDSMRTWVRVVLPGPNDNPIYWGSPSGGFNPVEYSGLNVDTDVAVYPTGEYVYVTWVEDFGDSTKIMNSVSHELDVGTWELGPTRIDRTSGSGIYFTDPKIAFGSSTLDMMWAVAMLHPLNYPTSYDRGIQGWYSKDYGSTWSNVFDITSFNNGYNETKPALAGSHINQNWVLLCESIDTAYTQDLDVYNYYATDDSSWTRDLWVTNSYENMLPDVMVDHQSNAFWAVLRQDRAGSGEEHVRVKIGDISDPTSWTQSYRVNDNTAENLSGVYGPSVSYNPAEDTLITAWTSYEGSMYSIWFDGAYSGIEEEKANTSTMRLSRNLTNGKTDIIFSINESGYVELTLHDITGRLLETVVSRELNAGEHRTTFEGEDRVSGVYFLKLETPSGNITKKMTLLK